MKDSTGRFFIQSLVDKAIKNKAGAVDSETYSWQNPGEITDRKKFAVVTYFEPWDWVIGASAYEDDFLDAKIVMEHSLSQLVAWFAFGTVIIIMLGLGLGKLIGNGIARPISRSADILMASTHHLSLASGEMSQSHLSLAQGASEQASSLEETSASLEEISSMTSHNAERAENAEELANQTRGAAETGASDMAEMSQAMDAIKTSSNNIAKIIKTIDEIAFQTNILALNAAVEAARAGEAGMGFAVVAEEVRNLAQHSALAAKETAEKIQDSIHKGEQAVQISMKVGVSLQEIVGKACKVDELVSQIANACKEQNRGNVQVAEAVIQMEKVTQSNASNAEETAASVQALNNQARILENTVAELRGILGETQNNSHSSKEISV